MELAEGKRKTCMMKGLLECIYEMEDCLANYYARFNSGCDAAPFCAGVDKEFYCMKSVDCFDGILDDCFCLFPRNLRCMICNEGVDVDAPDAPNVDFNQNLLESLGVTTSSYDVIIPRGYGSVLFTGNVIWLSEPRLGTVSTIEVEESSTRVTTEQYAFVDIAVGLTASQFESIGRIWIDGVQVLNRTVDLTDQAAIPNSTIHYNAGLSIEFYDNAEENAVDATMEPDNPGATPAYRGLSYVLFKDYPIFTKTRSIPQVIIELLGEVSTDDSENYVETIESYSDTHLVVDASAGKVYSEQAGEVAVLHYIDLEELNIIDSPISAVESSLAVDANGNLYWQDSLNKIYCALNGDDRFVYTLEGIGTYTAIAQSFVYMEGQTFTDLLMIAVGGTVHFVKNNTGLFSFTSLGSASWSGQTITKLLSSKIADDVNVIKQVFAFSQNGSTMNMYIAVLNNSSYEFDITVTPVLATFVNTTFVDAFMDDGNNAVIIMCVQSGVSKIISYNYEDSTINWNVTVAGLPTRYKVNLRRDDRIFSYIKSGVVYTVALATGIVETYATVAPEPNGTQYYDGPLQYVMYSRATGQIVKYFVDRFNGVPITVSEIAKGLLGDSGISARFYGGEATRAVDGFVVGNASPLVEYFSALTQYTGARLTDTGDRLTISDGDAHAVIPVSINEDAEKKPVLTKIDNKEMPRQVEVSYLDSNLIGETFTQHANIGETREDEDWQYEYMRVSFPITDTPDNARFAAERILAENIMDKDTLTITVKPGLITYVIGDAIVYEGASWRVDRITVDTTLRQEWTFIRYNEDVYGEDIATTGVVPAFTNKFFADRPSVLSNTVIALNIPPIVSWDSYLPSVSGEAVYIGQVRTDTSVPFEGIPVFAQQSNGTFAFKAVPTEELAYGFATTELGSSPSVFSTDYENTVIIEFDRDVTLADFDVPTDIEELYVSDTRSLLLVGRELIQYMGVSIAGDNRTVTFSTLMRGRLGTDAYVDHHAVGELCAIINTNALVRVDVSSRTLELGYTMVKLQDLTYTTISRTYAVPVVANAIKVLPIRNVTRFNLTSSQQLYNGYYIFYDIRAPYINTFTNTLPEGAGPQAVGVDASFYVLRESWDETLFRTNLELNDREDFPVNGFGEVSTNPYIIRQFNYITMEDSPNSTIPASGSLYRQGCGSFYQLNLATADEQTSGYIYAVIHLKNMWDTHDEMFIPLTIIPYDPLHYNYFNYKYNVPLIPPDERWFEVESDPTFGAPTVGNPVLGQLQGMLANGITFGPVEFGEVHLDTDQMGDIADITYGVPTVGSPALATTYAMTATEITLGQITLPTPRIGYDQLVENGIATGAPTVGAPSMIQYSTITIHQSMLPSVSSGQGLGTMYRTATGSRTFTNPTVSGRDIIVLYSQVNGGTPTVTDNKGNTYTSLFTDTISAYRHTYFIARNITGGAGHAVTITLTGGSLLDIALIATFEVSGLLPFGTVYDKRVSNINFVSGTSHSVNSGTLGQIKQLALAATNLSSSSPAVTNPGSPWSSIWQYYDSASTFGNMGAVSQIVEPTTALAPTWTHASASSQRLSTIVTFKSRVWMDTLTATGISTGTPTVGTPGRIQTLTATGIATGAPVVGNPTLTHEDTQNFNPGEIGVIFDIPEPQLFQHHILTASNLTFGTPEVTSVYLYNDFLSANGVVTGAPSVPMATIGQVHVLTATGIATGAPTWTNVTLNPDMGSTAGLTTGAPTIGVPEMVHVEGINVGQMTECIVHASVDPDIQDNRSELFPEVWRSNMLHGSGLDRLRDIPGAFADRAYFDINFLNDTVTGNAIIVLILMNDDQRKLISITDTYGNTYEEVLHFDDAVERNDSFNGAVDFTWNTRIYAFVAHNIVGGADHSIRTIYTGKTKAVLRAMEVRGLAHIDSCDVSRSAITMFGLTTQVNTVTTSSGALSTPHQLVIGGIVGINGSPAFNAIHQPSAPRAPDWNWWIHYDWPIAITFANSYWKLVETTSAVSQTYKIFSNFGVKIGYVEYYVSFKARSWTDGLQVLGIVTGAPTVGSPSLAFFDDLTATGIATGAPTVGAPYINTAELTATGIATGTPTVGTPIITQVHALTATGIATGTPTVGTPTVDGETASPGIGTAAIGDGAIGS
jgi:hypothetical protein